MSCLFVVPLSSSIIGALEALAPAIGIAGGPTTQGSRSLTGRQAGSRSSPATGAGYGGEPAPPCGLALEMTTARRDGARKVRA